MFAPLRILGAVRGTYVAERETKREPDQMIRPPVFPLCQRVCPRARTMRQTFSRYGIGSTGLEP